MILKNALTRLLAQISPLSLTKPIHAMQKSLAFSHQTHQDQPWKNVDMSNLVFDTLVSENE